MIDPTLLEKDALELVNILAADNTTDFTDALRPHCTQTETVSTFDAVRQVGAWPGDTDGAIHLTDETRLLFSKSWSVVQGFVLGGVLDEFDAIISTAITSKLAVDNITVALYGTVLAVHYVANAPHQTIHAVHSVLVSRCFAVEAIYNVQASRHLAIWTVYSILVARYLAV